MSDKEAVLFANEAFYLCFANADAAGMDRVWAERAAVTCIHPGWEALHGRDPVMESWHAIIGAGTPDIRCRAPRAMLYGDVACVICYEEIEGGFLIATNLFVREDGAWRMVHHQAGPTRGAPPAEEPEGESRSIN